MSAHGFGIVGCGMIANFHAQAIKEMANASLVGVYDVIEESARKVGEKFGVPWYTSYRRFLRAKDLEIVTICTPSGAHLEPAVKAARAGKHVICEKPLEVTLARCDRLIAACERYGVKLAGIFPSRYAEAARLIKEAVDSGRFGRLTLGRASIQWHRTQEYYNSGGWRGTWKLDGGGALMNQSIHTIDILQWFIGEVEALSAQTACLGHERIEVEDTAVAALRFRNGALGLIEGATSAYPGHPRRVELCGENGSAFLEGSELKFWQFREEREGDRELRERFARKPVLSGGASDPAAISHLGHQRQFEEFVNALEGKGPLTVDGPEARKAVALILAIYKSARRGGRPVKL